ncbi:ribonuclease H-like YkuK family protein [Metabacillus fastidiosus]|uniref:Ribonuclease H-like YkuK family protein n=1 Tax=Metabacillus fastidiosus TaxID=1458 RepID=A0ABU6P336_9BACI|nr:ribonuclease H-like YkuK family protein [Metabacillus fastidiosus]MED4403774.1 ribonuclease H-like YkuK family protein [Metabacillus fastidiosus]MED4452553.1 ribonuclease H-like YkuK family protein [Metabacillus fastidiosus]MED4463516.1 ribonuclease H-like YkuK family protein [Metabacillus fastidiosus]
MGENVTFYNISESQMSFDTVNERLQSFILQDPRSEYILSIGTDSHVHQRETRFITAIHMHRVGKGAWGCLRNYYVDRPIFSVREKISTETALSQEIAAHMISDYLIGLSDLLIPYTDEGADLVFEIHLDIGKKGITKDLIHEMTGRIRAMGIEAKIKPDSYAASSYANRYTK